MPSFETLSVSSPIPNSPGSIATSMLASGLLDTVHETLSRRGNIKKTSTPALAESITKASELITGAAQIDDFERFSSDILRRTIQWRVSILIQEMHPGVLDGSFPIPAEIETQINQLTQDPTDPELDMKVQALLEATINTSLRHIAECSTN